MARIELLGGLRVLGDGQCWEEFPRQKEAALLTLLALRPRQIHTRESLADALWPDADSEAARNHLRQTLLRLRQRLEGAPFLQSDKTTLRLTDDVTTDVQELEKALRRGDGAAARQIYRGELAPGCYEEPILAERNRLEALLEKTPVTASPPSTETPFVPALPGRLTAFFGRTREIELARERFREGTRLLTITGPGGTGKTRLAAEIAATLTETYRAVFVPLIGLTDAHQFFAALLAPLGIENAPQNPREAIVRKLNAHPYLLILDNLEQIASEIAEPVRDLLEAVPALRCLATSRIVIPVPGAAELPLRPLPLDDAAAMLLERVRLRAPDFALTEKNAPALQAITARLEGIPLALELAAGWAHLLSLDEMLSALENRWTLLQTTRPDVPERHRSLRSVIEASVSRLPERERRVFAELSVFHGFDAAAVTAVCELSPVEALETLSVLRDASLIVAEGQGRFSVLETLREYGRELLTPLEWADLQRRHCRHYTTSDIALRAHQDTNAAFYSRYEKDEGNLGAALRFGLTDTPETIECAAYALLCQFFHWKQKGKIALAQSFLFPIRALESRLPELTGRARAMALHCLGAAQSDFERAEMFYREAVTIEGNVSTPAFIEMLFLRGKVAEARFVSQEELRRAQDDQDWQRQVHCLNFLIHAHEQLGNQEESFAHYERLREIGLAHPNAEHPAFADIDRARFLCQRGMAEIAEERVRAAVVHFTALEHGERRIAALTWLANILCWQERDTEARIVLQEAAESARKRGYSSSADTLEAKLRGFPESVRREWNIPRRG